MSSLRLILATIATCVTEYRVSLKKTVCPSSVVRACNRYLGDHGLKSCRDPEFFLCAILVATFRLYLIAVSKLELLPLTFFVHFFMVTIA